MPDAALASWTAMEHFHNEFADYLNDSQYRVGMFIFMRTIAFNKAYEQISIKHFCEGVWDKAKQKLATAGVGGPKGKQPSAVREALTQLESLGIIFRNVIPGRWTEYGLNFSATKRTIEERLKAMGAGTPSDIRGTLLQNSGPPPLQNSGPPSKTSNTKTIIQKAAPEARGETDPALNPAITEMVHPNLTKVSEVVTSTKANTDERRKVNKAKGGGSGLWKTWADGMAEHYPGVPLIMWNTRQASLVKNKIVGGLRDHKPGEFIEYVVEHWSTILRDKFKYMDSKPVAPNIDFLCRFVESFIEARAEHDGKLSRHRAVANVRKDAQVEELEKRVAALSAERDKAERRAEAVHVSNLDQIGREASEAPTRPLVKPLKRAIVKPSVNRTVKPTGKTLLPDYE